ncbi:ABC transporter ATP-binding protein [Catenulispora pinistramenti]|uniref:ABC transporter ATP-binding protein n=1 Tax=Catenulispora pinistramenti TaxID=2705254 RepID=UPI001E4C81F9|nr:ABC transporter ATP-binding protein [Catenulispora pinistramenti]
MSTGDENHANGESGENRENRENGNHENGEVVNAEQNGAAANGASQNGAAQNGAAANGASQNGAAANGTAANGASQNGAGQNGAKPQAPGSADPASDRLETESEGDAPRPQQGGALRGPASFMSGPAAKSKDFKGSGLRLLSYLRPERPLLIVSMVMAAIGVGMSVWGPRLLGKATDQIFAGVIGRQARPGPNGQYPTKQQLVANLRATGHGTQADLVNSINFTPGHGIDFSKVGSILMVLAGLYVLVFVCMMIQSRLVIVVVNRCMARLRTDIEAKLSRLPLSYFDKQPRGEVLSRATNDVDNLAQSLQQSLAQIVMQVFTLLGVMVMMVWTSWLLALIAIAMVPLSVLVAQRIGKRSKPQFVQQWAATGRLNAHIEEMYTGHQLVKAFGRQEESAAEFKKQNDALNDASFKAQFISGLIQPAMMFLGNVTYVLVAVVGGLRVSAGALSLGSVQASIQYTRQFMMPLSQVAAMANLMQSGVASAERIFQILDAEEMSAEPEQPVELERVAGRVEFQDVNFSYSADRPLIEDLSLAVQPGQTVAIVGPTGAGKTTLVNLLMRFYEVDSGAILLDGVDTAKMTREYLRAQTGMVLQDAWLFGGTIADNIAYGTDGASIERIQAAAAATHVDHFVRTLPDGFDTVIDEEGSNLSAGEKQLVTIARAFLAEPAILILDEATSSVDTRTEVLIQRAMNKLREGRTSFVIAHRLSTIRDADMILVMENGRIVEKGTHTQLLDADGAYSRLYAAQFAQALAEVD